MKKTNTPWLPSFFSRHRQSCCRVPAVEIKQVRRAARRGDLGARIIALPNPSSPNPERFTSHPIPPERRPAAMLRAVALLALLAAAAPARAKDLPIAAIAAVYSDAIPACNGVLFPQLKAGILAATKACWGPIDTAVDAPPTECPSAECTAFAAALGPECWKDYHLATGAVADALLAALGGGAALTAAEVARMQRLFDNLTAADPKANPRVDVAAGLKAPDAAAVAALKKDVAHAAALGAACLPPYPPLPPPAAKEEEIGGLPTHVEAVYKIFADKMPACKGVLDPASAEFNTLQWECYYSQLFPCPGVWSEDASQEKCHITWPVCTDVCLRGNELWGYDCLNQYYSTNAELWTRLPAALAGGEALAPAEVAALQAFRDDLAARWPERWPALDWSKKLAEGDVGLGASIAWWIKGYFGDFSAECGARAVAAAAPAAAPAAASGGARAASAAASALLALLAA
jgi:hypothetical protein